MNYINLTSPDGVEDSRIAGLIAQLRRAAVPPEAIAVIQDLRAAGTPAVIQPLIEVLSHHHPSVPAAAVEALVQLESAAVEPLIAAFRTSGDQGVQAYIIQALARIGDARALDLLVEVVGVSVANHCQGNVRRVAARGLGRIGCNSPENVAACVAKLSWALLSAEDWALRYAAAVSLAEIGTAEAQAALQQALSPESDVVVQARIQTALEQLTGEKKPGFCDGLGI
ncbi:MAG TPA: HEAT repeat domain-containing protein [Oscillatoriaceae cyanobacterium M33_DOE_052]|uniref:HEAT repeat domain-containing protein n=1 Tax=Planktothricoides sp. SpSt-374 TaxID=2282167 RepID=A0A7C3VIS4_9CYAN|nr:HEAT repeat domain-containing protein [Oscillatoriaceae cyanobacterium M33_DOE_052]